MTPKQHLEDLAELLNDRWDYETEDAIKVGPAPDMNNAGCWKLVWEFATPSGLCEGLVTMDEVDGTNAEFCITFPCGEVKGESVPYLMVEDILAATLGACWRERVRTN